MFSKFLNRAFYALTGAVFLIVGGAILLLKTGILPESAREMISNAATGNLNSMHLLQEQACLMIFTGLLCFWFMRYYEQSKFFHWSFTIFWGLLALVHWFDIRGPHESINGPVVNTIPFLIYLMLGLIRKD